MKKLTTLLLAVSVVLCFGMAACAVEPCETHTYENGKCTVCDYECTHESYLAGACFECGIPCVHTGGTATCVEKKVCELCGDQYGEVDATAHVGGTATCVSGKICTACGEEYGDVDATAHVGGTATCIAAKVCTACNQSYGEIDASVHAGQVEWTTTDTKHSSAWSCCGAPEVAEEDHEWSNGACVDCGMAYPPHVHEYVEEVCGLCGDKQVLFSTNTTAEVVDGKLVYTITGGNQKVGIKNVDSKRWLSFDFMMNSTTGYAYIEPFIGDSLTEGFWSHAISNVKIVNKATGEKVTPTEAMWTGENAMENNVWYTVLVSTGGGDENYNFLFNLWASEGGTTKLANVKFLDISTTSGSALEVDVVDGETVYTLVKTAGGNCNQYGDNAFWFTTGEAEVLTFDFYSADFNYFQLCAGDGSGYVDFSVYDKVVIINSSNGQKVEYTDPQVEGGIWTGEVLPKNTWLSITVDVAGIQDLGIIFWASQSGTAQIANVTLK